MELPSLDLLRSLVAFAESRNLVEAAQRLGLSQPAVSIHLKRLEGATPVPVFSVEGKRKVLTHYGRALYVATRRELNRLEQSLEHVDRIYAFPEKLTLRVGARREIVHRVAQCIDFPGKIHFSTLSSQRAVARLLDHTVDLAVSHDQPDHPEIISRRLFSNGVMWVAHRKWLGSQEATLEMAADRSFLSKVPCLAYREDAPFLREWALHQGLRLRDLNIRYVCEDWASIIKLVEAGAGYSLVPDDMEVSSALVSTIGIPSSVIPKITHYALFHPDLRKIPAFKSFLKPAS
jgi:DNA-binding transcriptional LysR family regulator